MRPKSKTTSKAKSKKSPKPKGIQKKTKTSKPKSGTSKTQTKVSAAKPKGKVTKAKNPQVLDLGTLLNAADEEWFSLLEDELSQDYFKDLESSLIGDLKQKKEVFPPCGLIFNAFHLTPLDKVKVVILGQDPYHDNGQAHGLSFSVPDGIAFPPSLKNIFKELKNDIPGFVIPESGCLEKWAKQGVLLLNASLTVEAHKANSHSKYVLRGSNKEIDKLDM